MSILNSLFKPKEISDDNSYVDYSQYEQLNKSFRTGKANNRSVVDALDVGSQSVTGRSDILTKDDVLRKKKLLREYSRNIIVQAIIRTRTNQIIKYATPAYLSSDNTGFEIVPKSSLETDNITDKQKKRARYLEDFIYQTGKDYKPWRDNFPEFLTKLINDTFIFDQINIERVFEQPRSNQLNHFNIADAGTIMIDKYPKTLDKPREFVQWIDGGPVAHFKEKEMTFLTYWAQSDIQMKGYGFSPLDASLEHIGHHINTEQFNSRFFSQGGMVRGLLVLNADGSSQDSAAALEAIRRSWMPMQGLNGAWKIPMITASDAKFVNMTQNSKDMEFSEWLNYLIKVICANFNIQPEEINIPNKGGATGRNVGSTLNEGNSVKNKMQASKDTGLTPLFKFIERIINDQILRYIDSDYIFRFTLGNQVDLKAEAETIQARQEAGLTLNEGRLQMKVGKLTGPFAAFGDLPGGPKVVVQLAQLLAKTNPDYQSALQDESNPLSQKTESDKASQKLVNKDENSK